MVLPVLLDPYSSGGRRDSGGGALVEDDGVWKNGLTFSGFPLFFKAAVSLVEETGADTTALE